MRIFASFLLIALIAAGLFACGSDTPTPTPEPEPAPGFSPTPEPEPTSELSPTLEPESTSELSPTLEPESTSELSPAPESGQPIALALEPLGDNLLWVLHIDNELQRLSTYDPMGTFSVEQALPPGREAPSASEIGELTQLVSGQIYSIRVAENQTVELNGQIVTLYKGVNPIFWR